MIRRWGTREVWFAASDLPDDIVMASCWPGRDSVLLHAGDSGFYQRVVSYWAYTKGDVETRAFYRAWLRRQAD